MATEKLKIKIKLYATYWNKCPTAEIKIDGISYFKKEIEKRYDVTVKSVKTMICIGKKRVRGTKSGQIIGKTNTYKKAIVYLLEGDTIDFYSNI